MSGTPRDTQGNALCDSVVKITVQGQGRCGDMELWW